MSSGECHDLCYPASKGGKGLLLGPVQGLCKGLRRREPTAGTMCQTSPLGHTVCQPLLPLTTQQLPHRPLHSRPTKRGCPTMRLTPGPLRILPLSALPTRHLVHYLHRAHAHGAHPLQQLDHPLLVVGEPVGVELSGNRWVLRLLLLVLVQHPL